MAEQRPFPPSPRRTALAQRAGLAVASPQLVAAVAWIAAIVAAIVLARDIAVRVGRLLVDACTAADGSSPDFQASAMSVWNVAVELALPALVAIALAAFACHVAQNRAVWLPRRKIRGAPAVANDAGTRGRRATLELAAGIAVGAVTLGWLWWAAARLARLVELDDALPAAGALIVSFASVLGGTWLAAGVADVLARATERAAALRMTAEDKREDDRLAGADPRWRARRREASRVPSAASVMPGASLLVLGDGVAVAVAWDPVRRPVPTRVAAGRDATATQLLGLARRHDIPVHRDPALALELHAGDGPVPRTLWPRLAEVIAAVR